MAIADTRTDAICATQNTIAGLLEVLVRKSSRVLFLPRAEQCRHSLFTRVPFLLEVFAGSFLYVGHMTIQPGCYRCSAMAKALLHGVGEFSLAPGAGDKMKGQK